MQVTAARSDSIRRIVEADGILYPRNQASVVPKISAPVRTFYVNRGDHVREGQLLALLENRDLAAGAKKARANAIRRRPIIEAPRRPRFRKK